MVKASLALCGHGHSTVLCCPHTILAVLRLTLAAWLLQNGLAEKLEKSRKQIKERKNRSKKIRGVKKNAGQFTCSLVLVVFLSSAILCKFHSCSLSHLPDVYEAGLTCFTQLLSALLAAAEVVVACFAVVGKK